MSPAALQFDFWRGEPAPRGWKFHALLLCALLLLVPQVTGALPWLYEEAGLPLKPRDWTVILAGLALVLVFISRPAFCLPALALFALPMWRLADAALLQRYRVESLPGGPETYVMILVGSYLVTLTAIVVLAVRGGARIAVWFASASILVCTAANILEWLGWFSFTRIPGRVAGFLEDPNQSPITMCLLFGVLFAGCRNFWWNIFVASLASVAVALTLSRSGMAIFAFMVAAYLLVNLRRHLLGLLVLAAIAVPLAAAGLAVFEENASRHGVVRDDNATDRLEAIYELDFEKLKSPERAKDLSDGWEAVGGAVLTGYGAGAGTNEWMPHNQIVALWLDNGVGAVVLLLGFILVPAVLALRHRSPAIYCLIPVILFVPCSQVLLDSPVYWFALAFGCHAVFARRFAPAFRAPGSLAPSSVRLSPTAS